MISPTEAGAAETSSCAVLSAGAASSTVSGAVGS